MAPSQHAERGSERASPNSNPKALHPPDAAGESDLLIHSAAQLLTLAGGPQRGAELGRLGMVENGALAISAGRVVAVGPTSDLRRRYRARREIDAGGRVVLPGFVDPHTHVIWMGDRAAEFELRLRGATYMEIMAAGGGIASTVRQTRQASIEALMQAARPRLERMLAYGTTTAEAKTGYGLETAAELRMLEAIFRLDRQGPLELAPTLLGAHAVPPEFSGRAQDYVDLVCARDAAGGRASTCALCGRIGRLPFVDVFCEQGAFDLAQSRRILEAGAPRSASHSRSTPTSSPGWAARRWRSNWAPPRPTIWCTRRPSDIAALGRSTTVAVALPCTPFGLAEHRVHACSGTPGGRRHPGAGHRPQSGHRLVRVACSSSSPWPAGRLKLSPAQAIAAATINAAAAIGRQDRVGSLEPGKQADVLVLDAPDYRHLGYRFGTNLVSLVVKNGQVVHPLWPEG